MVSSKKGKKTREVYCICRRPDQGEFMICCDSCNEWYHGSCVNITEQEGKKMKKYFCLNCRGGEQPAVEEAPPPKKKKKEEDVGTTNNDTDAKSRRASKEERRELRTSSDTRRDKEENKEAKRRKVEHFALKEKDIQYANSDDEYVPEEKPKVTESGEVTRRQSGELKSSNSDAKAKQLKEIRNLNKSKEEVPKLKESPSRVKESPKPKEEVIDVARQKARTMLLEAIQTGLAQDDERRRERKAQLVAERQERNLRASSSSSVPPPSTGTVEVTKDTPADTVTNGAEQVKEETGVQAVSTVEETPPGTTEQGSGVTTDNEVAAPNGDQTAKLGDINEAKNDVEKGEEKEADVKKEAPADVKKEEQADVKKEVQADVKKEAQADVKKEEQTRDKKDTKEEAKDKENEEQEEEELVVNVTPAELIVAIESEVHKNYNEVQAKKEYNNKIRSLCFNLKDPKNPYFRRRLLSGELVPSALPTMSSLDLANMELANMRKTFEEKSMKKVAVTDEAEGGINVWRERREGLNWHLHSEHSLADTGPVISDLVNVGLKRSTIDGAVEPAITGPTVIDKISRSGSEVKSEKQEVEDMKAENDLVYYHTTDLDTVVSPKKSSDIIPHAMLVELQTNPPAWGGSLDVSTINELTDVHKRKFLVSAYHANGPQVLSITPKVDSFSVKGRMNVDKLYEYLVKIQISLSRSTEVVAFEPDDLDTSTYDAVFSYLSDNTKVLVMQVKQSGFPRLEEVYILSVAKDVVDLPTSLRTATNVSLQGKLVGVFIARTNDSASRAPSRIRKKRKRDSSHYMTNHYDDDDD